MNTVDIALRALYNEGGKVTENNYEEVLDALTDLRTSDNYLDHCILARLSELVWKYEND